MHVYDAAFISFCDQTLCNYEVKEPKGCQYSCELSESQVENGPYNTHQEDGHGAIYYRAVTCKRFLAICFVDLEQEVSPGNRVGNPKHFVLLLDHMVF